MQKTKAFSLLTDRYNMTTKTHKIIALAGISASFAFGAQAASAKTCSFQHSGFPSIQSLQASGVSCNVARTAGISLQNKYQSSHRLPKSIVGLENKQSAYVRFSCSYQSSSNSEGDTVKRASCRSSKGSLRMNLGS